MIDLNYFLEGEVKVTYRSGLKTTGVVELQVPENEISKAFYPFIFTPCDQSLPPLSYTKEGHYIQGGSKQWDIVEINYIPSVPKQQEPSPSLRSVALVLTPDVVESLAKDSEFQTLLSKQVEKTLKNLAPNTFQETAVKAIAEIVRSKIALAID